MFPATRFAAALALSCATLLSPVASARAAAASPVIDDAALEQSFTDGLAEPGADGLGGTAAAKALESAEGKTVELGREAKTAASAHYDQARRAVVVIGSIEHCKDCGEFHMGAVSSGWIIDPRGFIVTNHHVLADKEAGELGVMTFDGKVYPLRRVLASDREGDAAILEIDPGESVLSALPLASGAATGARIRVIGHPDGRFYSLSEGIVSRLFTEETSEAGGRRTWLTVTADFGSGSSGAPVLNAEGGVIGMVSSTAALLADAEEGKEQGASDVQMVFRDCVSVETMRALLQP